ncbi:murein biosynthesis integral membrane protein MurJ [Eubacterium multiforme]|uniref:Probable lipid II flippase MurJ n=1 Tax=Eubacterium multiforme TaxID=83339 RepID=A0ABT9UTA1_9FIRM|nr:murein biosynthesis integral membrane protein MurJ [Eubacterium multiforme]MDQ0149537.1 putative peptidoglycan lipid II flippase [Eubacterium multiforme]
MESNHINIAKSAMALSLISIITLTFSFFKESIFAYYYGASSLTDAFNVAIQIPTILFSLISTAISNVALPFYSKELIGKSKQGAGKYASNLMTVISILTIIMVIVCELGAKYVVFIFAPGLDKEIQIVAVTLFRIILPTILLTEMMNINTAILNVHKSFLLPSLMSIILNVTFVSCIPLLIKSIGIYAAVWGTVIGTCIEFIYSVLLRRKYMKYKFVCDIKDPNMISSTKKAIPVFLGIGADQINKLVDGAVSSFLREGSISTLNYALKLTTAISTLLIYGITTVVYPEFAESAAKEDDKRMADSFHFSMKMLILILAPVIFGGFILSNEIITIVFCRGAFTLEDVYRTAPLFSCYLVCLIFTAFRQVTSRIFYAYGDTKTPMKNSIIGISTNIILDIIFAKSFGALGLALATTVSTFIISLMLFNDLKKQNEHIHYKDMFMMIFKTVISCFVMMGVIKLGLIYMKKVGFYSLESFLQTVIITMISVLGGAIIYFIMLLILRTKEIKDLMNTFLKRR